MAKEKPPKKANAEKSAGKPKKPIYKRWWFWLIVVFVFAVLFVPSKGVKQTDAGEAPVAVSPTPEAAQAPQSTPNPLDAYDLPFETKVGIYNDIQSEFSGSDNPAANPSSTSEEITDWENSVVQAAADKYNVSFEDAEKIYQYVSQGYLYHLDNLDIKLNTGEILDVNANGTTLIVKAKVNSLLNNKQTVDQNYYNACEIIRSLGDLKISELQYWAVSEAQSGDDIKIISFTVPSDVIAKVSGSTSTTFADNTLAGMVTDLWILPSLQN